MRQPTNIVIKTGDQKLYFQGDALARLRKPFPFLGSQYHVLHTAFESSSGVEGFDFYGRLELRELMTVSPSQPEQSFKSELASFSDDEIIAEAHRRMVKQAKVVPLRAMED